MSPTDLEEIIQNHPEQAIRLTLSSGDTVDIPHADAVRISGTNILIFPTLERGRLFTAQRPVYVSTVNIAMAEPFTPTPPPRSN
jgi:hypothetical protein